MHVTRTTLKAGALMKNQTQNKKILKTAFVIATSALFFSCNNSKSNEAKLNSNIVPTPSIINSQKPLTNCNKTVNADISMNVNALTDSTGQANPQWMKVKFNFLSTKATAAGNVVRFFKWKIVNQQAYLDQTPLASYAYEMATGQAATSSSVNLAISDITPSRGFFIQMNDPDATFQVLKAVIYDSNGQIVAQLNSLIPQFYASFTDYQYNSDGTARAQLLTDMHPMKTTDSTGWTAAQFSSYYQQYCF